MILGANLSPTFAVDSINDTRILHALAAPCT